MSIQVGDYVAFKRPATHPKREGVGKVVSYWDEAVRRKYVIDGGDDTYYADQASVRHYTLVG